MQPPKPPRNAVTRPLIVGIGGTLRDRSSSEQAMRLALSAAAPEAEIRVFAGSDLLLPLYQPGAALDDRATALVSALAACDGLVIASPAYHGSISGLVKNALDYAEELARHPRPYLDGIPIGLIACAAGWQAAGQTLAALRAIAHALRGWPTPYGAAIRTSQDLFVDGCCHDEGVTAELRRVGDQVLAFARTRLQLAVSQATHSHRPSLAGAMS